MGFKKSIFGNLLITCYSRNSIRLSNFFEPYINCWNCFKISKFVLLAKRVYFVFKFLFPP